MKCPNCGANVSNDVKFCPSCGNSIEFSERVNPSQNSPNSELMSGIFNTFLSKPKLIVVVMIVLVAIAAFMFMGNNSDESYSNDGGFIQEIFGVSFHIPEGFVETYHAGPFSTGETVDFSTDDYDDLEIEVSPQYNVDLNSNHVKVKMQKTINGKDGVLVYYDSNRVSFYYDDNGYTIKLNTNSPDHDELFSAVII